MKTLKLLSSLMIILVSTIGLFGQFQQHSGNFVANKRLNGFINQMKLTLEYEFRVYAFVRTYDDEGAPNAYAYPDYGEGYSISLGYEMLEITFRDPEKGLITIATVMAHEYAHILQYSLECPLAGYQRELHADFLAGFFMARYFPDHLRRVMISVYDFGDFAIDQPGHHGTPWQRMQITEAGFSYRYFPLIEVYEIGIQLARSY